MPWLQQIREREAEAKPVQGCTGCTGPPSSSPPHPYYKMGLGGWLKEGGGKSRGRESSRTCRVSFFDVDDEEVCRGGKVVYESLELVKFQKKRRSGAAAKIQHQRPVACSKGTIRSYVSFCL